MSSGQIIHSLSGQSEELGFLYQSTREPLEGIRQEIDMISLFFRHIPLGAEHSRMMVVCIRGVVVKVGRNGQILDII